MASIHYTYERREREALIKQIGYGYTVKRTIVDKGHVNGPEIHCLSNTGIVTIYNQRTNKLITRLIARPGQVARYYGGRENAPQWLLDIAYEHMQNGYNEK